MPIDRRWTWIHTAVTAALLGGVLLVVVASKWSPWFAWEPPAPAPPATAYNLVLSIDSNIIRAQIIMEDLVYADDSANLTSHIKSVHSLTQAINNDFRVMGESFDPSNAQYNQALNLFQEWKAMRNEVIRLTASGKSLQAQKMVLGPSAAHVQKIRTALVKLERFSKKRRKDFESKDYEADRKEPRGQ